jgi:DNA-binding winged helix-turn-helix (wHTH) protein
MPVERFGDFELDERAAQLRLKGRELALQPRVFDLLAFLVRNRDRVVDKDELLAALWPGMIVTDASLQRAVSLARSALREGGLGDAIRTHARRGYRFCIDPSAERPEAAISAQPVSPLQAARALVEQCRWSEAIAAFAAADSIERLDAVDLERWALAAQCAGALLEAADPLERAAAAYSSAGDPVAAARSLVALARIRLEARESAVAKGCLRRAATLLEHEPLGVQHGHLAWMSSRFCLYEGDVPEAAAQAQRAIEIGNTLKNSDLQTMGLLYLGVVHQANGETRRGIEMQDEAAAAVLAGDVSPLIGGIVYCGLISGCCNAGDLPRAGQWTDRFERWCARSNLKTFAGSCLLHRAEVFAARGELERVQTELLKGGDALRVGAPWALGDGYRLLGDVHLARGEFEQAEAAYREAHEYGWDPYPGYAMLLHYRGQSMAAIRGLKRAVDATHWVARERRGLYLAHIALIAAVSGELEQAIGAMRELDAHPDLWALGSMCAQVSRARGEIEVARGNLDAAIRLFRNAIHDFLETGALLDAAIVRLSLAACLAMTGDTSGAELELGAAERAFEKTGATFYLKECARIKGLAGASPTRLPG